MAADANELDKTQPSLIQNNAEENTENAQNKQNSSFHFNAYDFCASLNDFLWTEGSLLQSMMTNTRHPRKDVA